MYFFTDQLPDEKVRVLVFRGGRWAVAKRVDDHWCIDCPCQGGGFQSSMEESPWWSPMPEDPKEKK